MLVLSIRWRNWDVSYCCRKDSTYFSQLSLQKFMNYLMIFSRSPTNFSGQVTIGLPGFPAWSLLAFQMNCWTRWDIFLGIFHDHYHFANHKCTSLCCKIILFLPCFSWRTRCLTLQCVEFTQTGDKFQISSAHRLFMKVFLSGPAHTWYLPSAIWGQEILHLKVRVFATKVVSWQNCVLNFTFCVKL